MKDKRRRKLILKKQVMRVREKKRDFESRTQVSKLLSNDRSSCMAILEVNVGKNQKIM